MKLTEVPPETMTEDWWPLWLHKLN